MRAVLDTNVLVSGLFWYGAPHRLLEHVRKGILALISSPALLVELAEVLEREKFEAILIRSRTSREHSLEEVRRLAEIIDPPPLPEPVCRDPDDDQVLALAVAAHVDFVASGDHDLLILQSFQDIPILSPTQALEVVQLPDSGQ